MFIYTIYPYRTPNYLIINNTFLAQALENSLFHTSKTWF